MLEKPISETPVLNLSVFLEIIDYLKGLSSFVQDTYWFRGENNIYPSLVPTHFRVKSLFYSPIREADLFFQYSHYSHNIHSNNSAVDIYFRMQHLGFPTRLLDFSTSPLIALYFATLNWNGKSDIKIICLMPLVINDINLGHRLILTPNSHLADEIDQAVNSFLPTSKNIPDLPIAILPALNSERIKAQNSVFILFGKSEHGLKEIKDGLKTKYGTDMQHANFMREIIISSEYVPEIIKELDLLNVNELKIYPDDEGILKYMKRKYRL